MAWISSSMRGDSFVYKQLTRYEDLEFYRTKLFGNSIKAEQRPVVLALQYGTSPPLEIPSVDDTEGNQRYADAFRKVKYQIETHKHSYLKHHKQVKDLAQCYTDARDAHLKKYGFSSSSSTTEPEHSSIPSAS